MAVVEDDGRTFGCDEEGDRGSCHDGGSGRGQLQAQPAQIRCRSCGYRRCADITKRRGCARHRRTDGRTAAPVELHLTIQCQCTRGWKECPMTLSDTQRSNGQVPTTAAATRPALFVDGASGTTGLGIRERLDLQNEVTVK